MSTNIERINEINAKLETDEQVIITPDELSDLGFTEVSHEQGYWEHDNWFYELSPENVLTFVAGSAQAFQDYLRH